MKTVLGKIVSDKMKNVVVVEMTRLVAHPEYSKRVRHTKKFHAQNAISAKLGDVVKLVETKPISKTVNWKVIEII